MNKAELVAALDTALGERTTPAQSQALVQQIVDTIVGTVVAGGKVSLTGFGVFEAQQRAARAGRNPYTGDTIRITATAIPKFRPSAQFKDLVAGRRKVARTGLATGRGTGAATTTPPRAAATKKPTTATAASSRTAAKKSITTATTAKKTAAVTKSSAVTKAATKSPAKKAAPRNAR